MKPEIYKIMVLPTCHLTAETNTLLGDSDFSQEDLDAATEEWTSVFVYNAEPGYFLSLAQDEEEFGREPNCIKDIILYASRHGCQYIRLDRDATPVKELPQYEW